MENLCVDDAQRIEVSARYRLVFKIKPTAGWPNWISAGLRRKGL